jgi:hypothetical protein
VSGARAALLLLLAAWSGLAPAGPLAVRSESGTQWRINDDDDPALVERRTANGKLDPGFGRAGRVELGFGGADVMVAALRVDASSRLWIAATTVGGGMSSPVVLRLLADGLPDSSWGPAGRSIAAPAGQRLLVADLLPLADGSCWIAGNLIGSLGEQTAALWRLKPDGSMDYGFGAGGLWRRPGGDASRSLSLAEGSDGTVALGLEVLAGRQPGREILIILREARQPGPGPFQLARDDDDDEAFVFWDGAAWQWRDGPQTALRSGLPLRVAGAAPAPVAAPSEAGHTALNPFSEDRAASAAAEPAAADEPPWAWLLGGAALLMGAFVWWRGRPS